MNNDTSRRFERKPSVQPIASELQNSLELEGEGYKAVEKSLDNIQEVRLEVASALDSKEDSPSVTHAMEVELVARAQDAAHIFERGSEVRHDSLTTAAVEAANRLLEGAPPLQTTLVKLREAGLCEDLDEVAAELTENHAMLNGSEIGPDITEALAEIDNPEASSDSEIKGLEGGSEKTKQQQDIELLFEDHPELAAIGTKEQYEAHLADVFPESAIKDILYHGTASIFEDFNMRPQTRNGSKFISEAAFFTSDINLAQTYVKDTGELKRVLVNVLNPKIYDTHPRKIDLSLRSLSGEFREKLEAEGYDSVINFRSNGEVAVLKSENIHTLGSKKDVQKFTSYVNTLK